VIDSRADSWNSPSACYYKINPAIQPAGFEFKERLMKTFLIVVLGMFVGGILSLIVLWFGIKFLIRYFVKKLVKALEGLGGQGVPPFRITLQKADDLEWKNAAAVDGVMAALVEVGYTPIGDFQMNELPNVRLRSLVNAETNSYGVIAEYNEKGAVLDIACDFDGGEHLTVTTAPESGLDRPDDSRLIRVAADLATDPSVAVTLHERLVQEQRGRSAIAASAEAFTKMYTSAHAREMDWRIARGGLTPEEVRRSCQVTGTEIPNDDAVELVCATWRRAISEFVDERLRAKFTNYLTRMSAAEWEKVRDRLYFVHDHSDRECVITELAARLEGTPGFELPETDGDDEENNGDADENPAYARLRPLFVDAPIRDAFVKAQDLLPAERRYRRIVGIKSPYGADVYVEPLMDEDEDE
jgi:hypothetical protein